MTRMLREGPAEGPRLVLAHGAGAPMDSPFMETVAHGLADHGVCVYRFEFPYMEARRTGSKKPPDRAPTLVASFRRVLLEVGPAFVGGKSMGGRIASMIADDPLVRGVVCLGYPFRPPKSASIPEDRVRHLRTLRTPTLLLQGTRDPFGGRDEVDATLPVEVHWLEDGDHDFAPRKRSGRTHAQNLQECIERVARFVHDHANARAANDHANE